jgi:hypothetical protein
VRMLIKQSGFRLIAVLTLALGLRREYKSALKMIMRKSALLLIAALAVGTTLAIVAAKTGHCSTG